MASMATASSLSSRSSVPPLSSIGLISSSSSAHPSSSSSTAAMSMSFSASSSSTTTNEIGADFFAGVFLLPLWEISQEVHPGFAIQREALEHVELLINQLLSEILNKNPHSTSDVDAHIQSCFPSPLDSMSVREASEAVERATKSRKKTKEKHLHTCSQKIVQILKERIGRKADSHVIMYVVAVLEYIAADILKLSGNYVKNIRHNEISLQDLKVAMRADIVLMEMFYRDSDEIVPSPLSDDLLRRTFGSIVISGPSSLNYEQTVKDLIHSETQYLRDLNIIVNVYRRAFQGIPRIAQELVDSIFSNIVEIHELTVRFIGLLEDTMEMTRESCAPAVGSCFLETAEGAEFEVYNQYSMEILQPGWYSKFMDILNISFVKDALSVKKPGNDSGPDFFLSVKYLLPKLMPLPIAHCLQYFEFLNALKRLSQDPDDQEDLRQTESLLCVLKSRMEHEYYPAARKKLSSYITLRVAPLAHQRAGFAKLEEIQKSLEGWESRALNMSCSGFICEGDLNKISTPGTSKLSSAILSPDGLWTKGVKLTDRKCFLFETVLILCKPLSRRSGAAAGGQPELRLKEIVFIRKNEVFDREDTDELKNAFELHSKDDGMTIILVAKNPEEKANWMAALSMLMMRSNLERMLDTFLEDEAKRVPLLAPPKEYRFGEPDSDENIIFEEYTSSNGVPVVRGATLTKLVERLTYHLYADIGFVKTFLTTYRAFCSPHELLSLLIDRFNVPDSAKALLGEMANETDPLVREMVKKFRKIYIQPVHMKVMNVIRKWVDLHWYDFEGEKELLNKLIAFLSEIKHPSGIVKFSNSMLHIIERKGQMKDEIKGFQFDAQPPLIEWHIAQLPEDYDLMTLHPVEIARQVTLLECDLYRAVKPIELVGAAWTKREKDERSPQLLKLIRHSTKFTYWLEKCIVACGNIDERVAVMNRILEIMCVFQELNNFTGVVEICCAMESSQIHRLDFTWGKLDQKLYKEFKKVKQLLLSDAHHKQLREKLRKCDPPCVPFFGMYLSNIIFLEDGNPAFLKTLNPTLNATTFEADGPSNDIPNSPLIISFTKCRKIAETIIEVQLYQNTPYCLTIEPSIRHFFETLDPVADHVNQNAFEDFVYKRSLEIEPKGCEKPPHFAPTRPADWLKSPGIEMKKSSTKSKMKQKGFMHPMTPSLGSARPHPTMNMTAPSSPSAMSIVDIGSTSGQNEGGDEWPTKKASTVTLPRTGSRQPQSAEPPKIPPRTRCDSASKQLPAPIQLGSGTRFVFPQSPELARASSSSPPASTVTEETYGSHSSGGNGQDGHQMGSAMATAASAPTMITPNSAPPPVLPPRTPRMCPNADPPPRPPKRVLSAPSTTGSPPPLPPKSYNRKPLN